MQALDLKALEIFKMVAGEGSVSGAALKLNRVQSNISTRIKQLEARLGKTLFRRDNRGLTLTPDGELLLTYTERLLELSQEATEAMNEGRPHGLLRIGTMESTAAARLPRILSRYHAKFPDVEVELETDTAGGLVRRLRDRNVEAAFIAEPVDIEGLECVPVFEEALVLVCPKDFPPLDDVSRVSGNTVIAFEQGCAYRRYLEDWLTGEGIVPDRVLSVPSYIAILASVSAGTGFAVVPESVLKAVACKGEIRTMPLPGKLSRIRTVLARREGPVTARLAALQEMLPRL